MNPNLITFLVGQAYPSLQKNIGYRLIESYILFLPTFSLKICNGR
jgi:hypothetical protein